MNFSLKTRTDKPITLKSVLLIQFIALLAPSHAHAKSVSQATEYTTVIYLKSSEVITGDSRTLNVCNNRITSISLNGHQYLASETDSIFLNTTKGIPFEDRWIFEKRKGTISLYTNLPAASDNKITFIAKKDTISSFSLSSLHTFVKDDPRSHSLIEQQMVCNVMACIPTAFGISYAVSQIFHTSQISNAGHGLYIPPIFFALGATFSLPCYFSLKNTEKALNHYNSTGSHKAD